ncbi:helix-turn-helix domain-containing protein [Actinacidiphila guanduensis]|uniref:Helix-turn-helix domain-containing protein n=1 Tax=Actinacidiphila guanduensis TaxID=310781 RepID=A0A1H0FG45_9ACTN|nr:helix-turn-helix transcriptional regulator [Actinacidiphila guanduensis]SDN93673.1 Helix-turn-helix domain-containing protein [Actinacidiphila guanduensis]
MANIRKFNGKKLDPSLSTRAMYGAEMRYQREKAGLSQAELAALLYVTPSFIANLETGRRRIHPDMAKMLDRVLKTDGFFLRNVEAGRATPYPEHFADVAELETVATEIREWELSLVPGLLQTEAYALALIRAYDPLLSEELVRVRLNARLIRAGVFDSATSPMYWAVLDECVLRRPVGGMAAMAEQLRHVAAMIRRNRALVQVLPLNVGAHAGLHGSLRLMEFENDAPMAYLAGLGTGKIEDDPATVRRYKLAYDLLGAAALSPEASLTLIEAVAEEYEHGAQFEPAGDRLA